MRGRTSVLVARLTDIELSFAHPVISDRALIEEMLIAYFGGVASSLNQVLSAIVFVVRASGLTDPPPLF